MAHYKMSDVAVEVNERENNPANSQYERFVGLEHYVSGEVIIRNYGSTQNLESTMKIFHSGDVLVARRNVYLKRAATVDFDGLTSGDSIVLRAKNPIIGRILPFVLNTDEFWDFADQYSDGTMSKRLSPKTLMTYEFDLPNEDELESFADLLWAANDTRESYQELLRQTDELVKSQFIEMFGDPVENPMGWKKHTLDELSIKITDGVHKKPNYTSEGRPFVSVTNINRGVIDFNDCKYVSEEDYQKMIKTTFPEKGDVLYTKVGATYGIPAYIDTDIAFGLYVSVCLIKPDHDKIDARFLTESMRLDYVKKQADDRIKGIGVPDLHLKEIKEFWIVCPPSDLQIQYVKFVEQTDKSKYYEQNHVFSIMRGGELCA